MIVMAPGGKLVTICDAHMTVDRAKSIGVARSAAGRSSTKGLLLMEKSNSIVDTFIVETRIRCQRYCTKATASAARRKKPNVFARTFEAVEIYDCGATSCSPSASFPSRYRNSRRCAMAMESAAKERGIVNTLS